MQQSPIVLLDATDEERVDITFNEYITRALDEYRQQYGTEQGLELWADYLMSSINKIRRRLGHTLHKTLQQLMTTALRQHREHNDPSAHKAWIHRLLLDYYDPMYDYQLGKKQDRIIFKGNHEQVLSYLQDTITPSKAETLYVASCHCTSSSVIPGRASVIPAKAGIHSNQFSI